jgi:glycosidase
MFAGGVESGEIDHFDSQSELYRYISELAMLRQEYPALRYGEVKVLKTDPNGPGIFVYSIEHNEEKIFGFNEYFGRTYEF